MSEDVLPRPLAALLPLLALWFLLCPNTFHNSSLEGQGKEQRSQQKGGDHPLVGPDSNVGYGVLALLPLLALWFLLCPNTFHNSSLAYQDLCGEALPTFLEGGV